MAHEDLSREQRVEGSSDRSFAVVFVVVFLIISLWPLWSGGTPRGWAAGVAAVLAAVALLKPAILAPLNRLWLRFGLLLGKIVGPIALGVVYFLVLAPIGILARVLGKDSLRLKPQPAATTYWKPRQPPGPAPQSMNRQF